MTDEMLRALAPNGGVIQINYDVDLPRARRSDGDAAAPASARPDGRDRADVRRRRGVPDHRRRAQRTARHGGGPAPAVTWEKIVDHIDHAAKVAGVDHVGLGSDFDGATMPFGMEDASQLPRITEALLAHGLLGGRRREDLGGNILRQDEGAAARLAVAERGSASSGLSLGGRGDLGGLRCAVDVVRTPSAPTRLPRRRSSSGPHRAAVAAAPAGSTASLADANSRYMARRSSSSLTSTSSST